jgi:hypothetical protein
MTTAQNLQFTWKRMAEEREATARNLARIAIGLFVACNVFAFTTYSGHSRNAELCRQVVDLDQVVAGRLSGEAATRFTALQERCQ